MWCTAVAAGAFLICRIVVHGDSVTTDVMPQEATHTLMETKPEILAPDDSALLRHAYLDTFVDTQGEHFKKYIRTRHMFSDGEHYEGYIWDCLLQPRCITFKYFTEMVKGYDRVFVFADDHSRDRIVGAPLWPYAPLSVARFQSNKLLECLPMLPEDIYVFDSSVSWTLVLTHEYDQKRRVCCSMGIKT